MTMVWDAFPASGSQLLAMLAMADWCDDKGGSLYPSMQAVADKIRVSEKQARRLVKELVDQGYLQVVGNAYGGAPGSTKQFRVNVQQLKVLVTAREKAQTPPAHVPPPSVQTAPTGVPRSEDQTAPVDVTPPTSVTPPMGVPDGSHRWEGTAPTGVPKPLPPMGAKPSLNHQGTVIEPLPPAAPPALELISDVVAKPAKAEKTAKPDEAETALQAACRETWAAYATAYAERYGIAPVRNAPGNAKVKAFVQRIGQEEAPGVARFFVERVNDRFVVGKCHDVGLLLNGAEGYRTQWATGQAMTSTRAHQADKSQANFDAADEAMALIRARRGVAHAE